MCGIAGIISSSQQTPPLSILKSMGDSISHRGPDDVGYYQSAGVGFCHRRLSIIDLTSDAHQPMSNEDGTIWIAYNGEIYNFEDVVPQLTAGGHVFKSHSDTEVIVHGYEEYGIECLKYFNGMFSFALWDSPKNLLFAARDRLGIKPFYYFHNGSQLIFGSEIKALFCHPDVPKEPDLDVIRQYLLFGNTMGNKSWYRGIQELPPGCYLLFEDGKLTVNKYWDIKFETDYSRSFTSFEEELRALLQDAVRLHLRSDVPVGAYLSGGIDSSSIVALASSELKGGIHTFSAAFDEGKEYDEREYIRIVSEKFGTHHHGVVPTSSDLSRLLPALLWHLDEPVIGAAIIPMYSVSGLVAKAGIKVVNGGQGGDELFGGYPPFYVTAAKNILGDIRNNQYRFPAEEMLHLPEYLIKGGAVNRLLSRFKSKGNSLHWMKGATNLRDERISKYEQTLKGCIATNSFDEMTYLNIKHGLKGLLQQEDRMSMAWSIESRVPFLDYRLVEFSAKIPSWYKVRQGVLKCILREAVRGIVPDVILNRRDKKGYPTPSGKWFSGELSGYIKDTLTNRELLSGDIVDPAVVTTMVNAHINRTADYGHVIWSILNVELWMRGVSSGWKEVEKKLL